MSKSVGKFLPVVTAGVALFSAVAEVVDEKPKKEKKEPVRPGPKHVLNVFLEHAAYAIGGMCGLLSIATFAWLTGPVGQGILVTALLGTSLYLAERVAHKRLS